MVTDGLSLGTDDGAAEADGIADGADDDAAAVGSDDMLGLCEEPLGTILGCDDGIPLALGLCDGADVVDGELVETAGLYNSVSRYSLSG